MANSINRPELLTGKLPVLKVQFSPKKTDFTVQDSFTAYRVLKKEWKELCLFESTYAILMNNGRLLHGCCHLGTGSYKSCDFDESLLYGLALVTRSTKIIIAHNHTSGRLLPSERDKVTTQRVKDGCELLGIKLVDHIIMGTDCFYSFADHDLIL